MNSKTKVVILGFNHEGITQKCVESALRFFKAEDIVLVHNGSREKSVKILRDEFPNIKHLEIKDNTGFSGGANQGISFAFENVDCEQVLFLSNDTQLTKFENQIIKSKNFLGAPIVELRETGNIHSFGASVDLTRGTLKHLNLESRFPPEGSFYVPGSAFLVSKSAWQVTTGFDGKLGSYWEDVDLSLKAHSLRIDLLRIPHITVKHAVAKTTGGDPFYTVFLFHRNRKRVVLRYGSFSSRFCFVFVYKASTLRKLFKYLINKDIRRVKLLLKAAVSW